MFRGHCEYSDTAGHVCQVSMISLCSFDNFYLDFSSIHSAQ